MKRGIVMPAGLIAVGLPYASLQAVPAHLISSISGQVTGELGPSTSNLALAKGAAKLMTQTKTKTAIIAAVTVLVATSAGLLIRNNAAPPPAAADEARIGGPGNPLPDWRALIAAHPAEREKVRAVWCFDNMRQVDAAVYYWAETHDHRFPDDLVALKENDRWQISPRYLTCPSDTPKKEVRRWAQAQNTNVSYGLVAPGAEFTRDPASAQPCYKCPIHGHIIRTDATVAWGDSRFPEAETCRAVASMAETGKRATPDAGANPERGAAKK